MLGCDLSHRAGTGSVDHNNNQAQSHVIDPVKVGHYCTWVCLLNTKGQPCLVPGTLPPFSDYTQIKQETGSVGYDNNQGLSHVIGPVKMRHDCTWACLLDVQGRLRLVRAKHLPLTTHRWSRDQIRRPQQQSEAASCNHPC